LDHPDELWRGLDYEAKRVLKEVFSPCGLAYDGESCWERIKHPVFGVLAENGAGDSNVGSLNSLSWNSIHDWFLVIQELKRDFGHLLI